MRVVPEGAYRAAARARPFKFALGRYRDAKGFFPHDFFLHRQAPPGWALTEVQSVPRTMWCIWAGDNPLTPNRERGLVSIRQHNWDLDVKLVTPENLEEYVVEGHPLHPAYAHLSAVHRSDYLRAYLLHHHGGVYSDIKPMQTGVAGVLSRISGAFWVVGYPEIDSDLVDNLHGRIGDDVRRQHHRIIGMGVIIARPRSALRADGSRRWSAASITTPACWSAILRSIRSA